SSALQPPTSSPVYTRRLRRLAARACLLVLMSSVALYAQPLSTQDATRVQPKRDGIQKNALTPAAKGKTRQTQVTDAEVNAYLKFLAVTQVPVGIVDATLHAAGN